MVDFTDSEDVKRWLDAIEPARRRREAATALAARAALRGLPLLAAELGRKPRGQVEIRSGFILQTFRSAALAWAAAKFNARAKDLRHAAGDAADAVLSTNADLAVPDGFAGDIVTAAAFAAVTVRAGAASKAVGTAAIAVARSAAAFGDNIFDATNLLEVENILKFNAAAVAASSDASAIDARRSGPELAGSALWPRGAPDRVAGAWQELKAELLTANEGWEVWAEWYDARLAGDAARPPNETLEVARATIPDEIWRQGPAAVNAEIKRLIKEYDRGSRPAEDQDSGDDATSESDSPPEDFTPTLDTRSALRVLPLLVNDRQRIGDREKSKFVLAIFRALAVAWAQARYPSAVSQKSCLAAAHDVRAYAAGSEQTVLHVAEAAANAAYSAGSVSQKVAITRAAQAHLQAKEAGSAATGGHSLQVILDDANSQDAGDIILGSGPTQVAEIGLWRGRDLPPFLGQHWNELKEALRFANEGWEVWIDWYEARLDGRVRPQEIELAYVEFSRNVASTATAWEANSEIKRLIVRSQSLQQRPAAFQFRVVDDKIDALPDDARPIDAAMARDFYDEAKRKGQDLKDRLQRTQADENIHAHVDLLLARLGSSYADMRPGLMISALRSLESDVRAYDSEEGRKELAAAHLSSIFNLADSVRDLCAIFPRSREIEAEAVSLDLPMQRLPEIRVAIDSVVAKVNRSDGATEGGREAINASATDLAHQRGLAEEAKQSAYFLVDFANFTRAGIKHLKATGRAVGGEIAGLGADSWRAVRRGAPKGVERGAAQAGKALVVGGVAVLMHWLGSDIAALGAMVGPYLPLHEMLAKMTGAAPDAPAPDPDAGSSSTDGADDAPAPQPPKPRKPNARKRRKM